MALETVTMDEALQILSLPRTVGAHPESGEVITVQNGRYGPYLKMGSDSRSLETEAQLLTITLEECLAILAQPKRRRGQTVKPPLREMGEDPESGKPMIVKDGRFGPYVTDGEYNAPLRKGDTVEELTIERAAELLADRRAKGPAKKAKKAKKATKKKAKRRPRRPRRRRPRKRRHRRQPTRPSATDRWVRSRPPLAVVYGGWREHLLPEFGPHAGCGVGDAPTWADPVDLRFLGVLQTLDRAGRVRDRRLARLDSHHFAR